MTEDGNVAHENKPRSSQNQASSQSQLRQWFATPAPIKRLFDRFPLVTYPSNELPHRIPRYPDKHVLYAFFTEDGARNDAASFNPGCLKWQAYLKFLRIPFVTVPSNNHASPSGALPFLLPASVGSSASVTTTAIPSSRIQRWSRDVLGQKQENVRHSKGHQDVHGGQMDGNEAVDSEDLEKHMRYEAYLALLDHRIRNAYVSLLVFWCMPQPDPPLQLYSLYLSSSNFASIAQPLYIDSTTSNTLVRLALAHQLRAAAQSELLKQSATIDVQAIYNESDKAFEALSELLGEEENFFREARPGLFDASVFAYTNILLDEGLEWKDKRIHEGLQKCENLVAHRRRIVKAYF
ncbi:hypothetical protein ACLMJK_006473 [Lecanora helva]